MRIQLCGLSVTCILIFTFTPQQACARVPDLIPITADANTAGSGLPQHGNFTDPERELFAIYCADNLMQLTGSSILAGQRYD